VRVNSNLPRCVAAQLDGLVDSLGRRLVADRGWRLAWNVPTVVAHVAPVETRPRDDPLVALQQDRRNLSVVDDREALRLADGQFFVPGGADVGSTSVPTSVVVGISANPVTVSVAVAAVVAPEVVVGGNDVVAPLVVPGAFASLPPPPKQAGRRRTAADDAASSTAILKDIGGLHPS
jgi:hypothetical protein